MKNRLIVKVQIPLFSTEPDTCILVYNETRTIMEELRLRTKKEFYELLKRLKGEPKGYFYAKLDSGRLMLTGVAPWQAW